VVKVLFNPAVTNKEKLEALTKPKDFSACSSNEGFRADREPKYYLLHSNYRAIPMTSLQACRVNSLIGQHKSPDGVLSPRQLAKMK
jgi:hypothetical protein